MTSEIFAAHEMSVKLSVGVLNRFLLKIYKLNNDISKFLPGNPEYA